MYTVIYYYCRIILGTCTCVYLICTIVRIWPIVLLYMYVDTTKIYTDGIYNDKSNL